MENSGAPSSVRVCAAPFLRNDGTQGGAPLALTR